MVVVVVEVEVVGEVLVMLLPSNEGVMSSSAGITVFLIYEVVVEVVAPSLSLRSSSLLLQPSLTMLLLLASLLFTLLLLLLLLVLLLLLTMMVVVVVATVVVVVCALYILQ